MDNKKILVSFLLVVLIALSISAVSAADAGDVVLGDTIQPNASTVDAVQFAINSANESDTIDISNYDEYDFGNSSVTIDKTNVIFKGNGNTVIKGHGSNAAGKGNALIEVSASNVTIQGITFIDTNPANDFKYNGTVMGTAVRFMGVDSGLLSNCTFTDFSSAAIVQKSSGVVLEDNYVKGGYTTIIANDPTVNVEKGTKAFNIYGQSSQITVRGNTFEGQQLDGISIAQGSGSNVVEDNTFIGNTYGIYFGGASTKNSVIRNNKFIDCGYFEEGDVVWTELPVISIQKAANDIAIEDNYFEALDNSVLIAAEEGNEAHGFPSALGNINVTGNTVVLANGTKNASSVTLFHVLCRDSVNLKLFAPLKVENNTLADGINEYVVESAIKCNSSSDIQALIDAAQPGDVVDLSLFDAFDFKDTNIVINKSITLKGNGNTTIYGHGANAAGKGNALVEISASNVTVTGINFVDTHPANDFKYNGTVMGTAVRFMGVDSGLLSNCTFTDFSSAAIVQKSTGVVLEDNYVKGGYTTIIANDPTVNVEKGTKAFNIYGQSSQITVRGNTFEGQQLDGISIAQGSGSNVVEDNTFIGNTYGIYFGGASTKNSVIRNNTFIGCGYFKEGDIEWTELPIISIQKAANDIAIEDNTFEALSNSVLIAAEQGNEAHGFPSALGNINVTGNKVVSASNDTDAKSVLLFSVLCRNGPLNLSAPINVTGNTVEDGMKTISVQTLGDVVLEPETSAVEKIDTIINVDATFTRNATDYSGGERGGFFYATLTDINGNPIANATVQIAVNGPIYNKTTDEQGKFGLQVNLAAANTYTYALAFQGNEKYNAAPLASSKLTVVKKSTSITASAKTFKSTAKTKKITVTLKTIKNAFDGKTYLKAGKKLTLKVNGVTYTAKINAKGQATFSIKLTKKGKFNAVVKFAGDKSYKASSKTVKITIN